MVDPTYKPVGAIPISILLRSRRETPLAELMEAVDRNPDVDMDQEEVAYIFDKYHLISAPVIEPGGRLVGQITVDDIVEVIRDEAQEDILALAGVSDAGRDASVVEIVKSRLPWLMLNLATATLAVSGVAIFQAEIAQLVALAILMPIVSSLGGNAGTQTLAVAVRALASKELTTANARRIILRELLGRPGQWPVSCFGHGHGDLPVLRSGRITTTSWRSSSERRWWPTSSPRRSAAS